jgi:hypothetical protein
MSPHKRRSKKPYSMKVYLCTINLTLFGMLEVVHNFPGPWMT